MSETSFLEHEQKAFLWRTAKRRARGRVVILAQGGLIFGLMGAFLALIPAFSFKPHTVISFMTVTFLASTVSSALEFLKSTTWRRALRWLGAATFLCATGAIFFTGASLIAPIHPMLIGAFTAIGALVGIVLYAFDYQSAEARFQRLLEEGATVPERPPLPSRAQLLLSGVLVLMAVLITGPTLLAMAWKPD